MNAGILLGVTAVLGSRRGPGGSGCLLLCALLVSACADARDEGGTDEADGQGDEFGGSRECDPDPRGSEPEVALPSPHEQLYELELDTWGISNTGGDPVETRTRMNEALAWALDNGFDGVRIPAGTYRVGEKTSDIYTAGIELPGSMDLILDPGATLEMAPNDTWNYCVVAVRGLEDVRIAGGRIVGDRDEHSYGGADDEGHGICVEGASKRVLIEDIELTKLTGDGVLIVGQSEAGSCEDITIRDSELHENRRQGVSIVGGIRVLIEGNEIHHIHGTAPQFGVDIESLSFTSKDIMIRDNSFHDNQAGDFVNTDGTNVWFQGNTLDQGDVTDQVDGPIVVWKRTDQTIRDNVVIMHSPTVNGLWGVIGYTNDDEPRANPVPNYIEDNVFEGGGIHLARNQGNAVIRANQIDGWMILGSRLSCLRLSDNVVNKAEGESYKFREVQGVASGNLLNGTPVALPMSDDAPFTNSPPHLW